MHVFLSKYKEKLSHLPLNELEKARIFQDFQGQLLRKLLDGFYNKLTEEEKDKLTGGDTVEKMIEIYFTLLLEKIDYPDFIDYFDQTYINILSEALSNLPDEI